MMFLDEVHDLKDRFPDRFQILHVLSREQQDVELLSGRLDAERFRGIVDAFGLGEADDWFLCGPQRDGGRPASGADRPRGEAGSTPSSSTPTLRRGHRSRPWSAAPTARPR